TACWSSSGPHSPKAVPLAISPMGTSTTRTMRAITRTLNVLSSLLNAFITSIPITSRCCHSRAGLFFCIFFNFRMVKDDLRVIFRNIRKCQSGDYRFYPTEETEMIDHHCRHRDIEPVRHVKRNTSSRMFKDRLDTHLKPGNTGSDSQCKIPANRCGSDPQIRGNRRFPGDEFIDEVSRERNNRGHIETVRTIRSNPPVTKDEALDDKRD